MKAQIELHQPSIAALFPISRELPVTEYGINRPLFEVGKVAKSVYLVRTGIVRHSQKDANGREFIMAFSSRAYQYLLGAEALDDNDSNELVKYTTEARTLTPVLVQKISKEYIQAKMSDPTAGLDFTLALLQHIEQIIRVRTERLASLHFQDLTLRRTEADEEITHQLGVKPTKKLVPAAILAKYLGCSRGGLYRNWQVNKLDRVLDS